MVFYDFIYINTRQCVAKFDSQGLINPKLVFGLDQFRVCECFLLMDDECVQVSAWQPERGCELSISKD